MKEPDELKEIVARLVRRKRNRLKAFVRLLAIHRNNNRNYNVKAYKDIIATLNQNALI